MRVIWLAMLPLLAASVAGVRFPRGMAPMDPGPVPRGLTSWSAAECGACHPGQAESWALSAHAHARTNLVFRAAVRREDPAWCVGCHAPLASSRDAATPGPDAPAEERGVTCAACHGAPNGVAAARDGGVPEHAIDGDAGLRDAALCGGCHQFGFAIRDGSGRIVRLSDDPQQDTVGEWERWRAATGDSRGCIDCHMRAGDHSMGGVRRVERMRDAIEVAVRGRTLTVTPREVGHRLPTGDVMRWISVEASPDAFFERTTELARFGRTLVYGLHRGEPLPYLGSGTDTRLDGPVRVTVPARDPRGRALVAWRIVYHLVSPSQEEDGMLPAGVSRIVLHAGMLEDS